MKDQSKNKINNEDLKWVRKAKKGNQKAFEKLVLKYQKRVYYSIRKMVLDHDDANDIVQDTFVKAYLNLNRFDQRFPFYSWLFRIAINTTINFQTKISRRKKIFPDLNENEIQQCILSNNNQLKDVLQNELNRKVVKALEKLPLDQRVVFILKTSEGLSYQEISEQLDISIGTVMSRLSRARTKLRELLQYYLESETK